MFSVFIGSNIGALNLNVSKTSAKPTILHLELNRSTFDSHAVVSVVETVLVSAAVRLRVWFRELNYPSTCVISAKASLGKEIC